MKESLKMENIRITDIQRFCLHDGPGIRTTVFLKGCSLHCPWCANPETRSYELQPYYDEQTKRSGCYGYDISAQDLMKEFKKDLPFFLKDGGITFSGGEPLLQIKKYELVLQKLKSMGVHLALETALFVPEENVRMAIRYFDWIYTDLKILQPDLCREILHGDSTLYQNNFQILHAVQDRVHVRIPCRAGYTINGVNEFLILDFLKKYEIKEVEMFRIHALAKRKYELLGESCLEAAEEDQRAMETLKDLLTSHEIQCQVNQL